MLVFWAMKEHIIDLLTRLTPGDQNKRNYQNLMWEERTVVDLWNYTIPGMFADYSNF
jgi:hypothetical protein